MKKVLLYIAILALFPTLSYAAFDTNLSYGARGTKVSELQEFLTDQGVYAGPITGNFFTLTLNGVKALQTKYAIKPQSGFFGPLTRAQANKVLDEALSASGADEMGETGNVSTPTQDDLNAKIDELNNKLSQIETNTKQTTVQQSTPVVTQAPFSPSVTVETTDTSVLFTISESYDVGHIVMNDGQKTYDQPMRGLQSPVALAFAPGKSFSWELTLKRGNQQVVRTGTATEPIAWVKLEKDSENRYSIEERYTDQEDPITSIKLKLSATTSLPQSLLINGKNLYIENGDTVEEEWTDPFNMEWKSSNAMNENLNKPNDSHYEIISASAKTASGKTVSVRY